MSTLSDRSPEDQDRVARAYHFAERAHDGVLRKSGEPYITHPVTVAQILADLGMDTDGVIAGLLHDTVEDTDVTFEQVEQDFGVVVRRIVEGETKVSKLTKMSSNLHDEQSENLRQMLIAMTGDIRVIIVKLADRLHNMRTLASMPAHKQQRIARETLEIFAPLAHRLGIGQIKWELEDLSFKYLDPDAYESLERRLRTRQSERERHIVGALEQLRATLEEDVELPEWVASTDITGRGKHLYSIHNKMRKEGKSLEQIFDLLAVRVILRPKPVEAPPGKAKERAEDAREKRVCYHALGLVHSMWTPIPGRFKDYIAVPKPNGYQSLHTTVISTAGQPIEVQIRSQRMHEVAEFGIAAHWMYKQGGKLDERSRENWLVQLRQLQLDITDASDFVDAVKSDLLSGRVFVFTPKGDTVNLPQGSTPVDFAYHIHSRIGDTTVGARINGSIVPLGYQLKNGDMVEIISSRNSSGPSHDWLNFAVTRSARAKIRHFFRAKERQEAMQSGHDTLERYLRKRQLPVRQLMRTKLLEDATEKLLGTRNPDDLYLAIQAGKLASSQAAKVLAPQLEQEQQTPKPRPVQKVEPGGVYVEGMSAPTKIANCCHPIRGDHIMGYITRGRGVSIHRIDCPNMVRLLKEESDRCVSASWDPGTRGNSIVDLDVVATDRPGLLADVLAVVAEQKRSPMRIEAGVAAAGTAHIYLRLTVGDQTDLSFLADAIRRVQDVQDVMRAGVRGGKRVPAAPRAVSGDD
ncbi:RelA/SpoT family protein [Deinococcus peraridilitoris]|uniref:(P)ppGpp synthetase, RelA/SpoT family n=1 Tax=Deinococcus peraridilitoris (strain DSM 19664 / LMG 22246 / CIP 109416 / KR-200) TaxID=937777 RepID=L0A721_DEIPD|nr:bifunctional (p)ppGpp synthetase/guanosine-3',5'-bis(diphosphate) 3'-pyrophosphohydrolase [Deinococcus peraridilitoris]AFZ69249.1 (p)ppGpp synthetase, RelA/SpoT family [Deinococcus peraridilitoris DSM 19664]